MIHVPCAAHTFARGGACFVIISWRRVRELREQDCERGLADHLSGARLKRGCQEKRKGFDKIKRLEKGRSRGEVVTASHACTFHPFLSCLVMLCITRVWTVKCGPRSADCWFGVTARFVMRVVVGWVVDSPETQPVQLSGSSEGSNARFSITTVCPLARPIRRVHSLTDPGRKP